MPADGSWRVRCWQAEGPTSIPWDPWLWLQPLGAKGRPVLIAFSGACHQPHTMNNDSYEALDFPFAALGRGGGDTFLVGVRQGVGASGGWAAQGDVETGGGHFFNQVSIFNLRSFFN